jgi:hypothetical protein
MASHYGADVKVSTHSSLSRRRLLARLANIPLVGGAVVALTQRAGWASFEEKALAAPRKGYDYAAAARALKGSLPQAQIGNMKLSRMILGGNLMGGWAHARDLIYVSRLVREYHTREKTYHTLQLAEACGVNALLTNPMLCGIITSYWKDTGGKIQFISDCGGSDPLKLVQQSIDAGAASCYIQGGVADDLVKAGKFDVFAKALELIRRNNLPAGIGAHKLSTVQACVDKGLKPDYWMKTLHHRRYWSARHPEENDNVWCDDPEQTIAYMAQLKEPFIAFKVLAAGAIQPRQGFRYAFTHGADFICVGMYDFQMVEDVNIAIDVLNTDLERKRPWCA